MKNNDKIIKVGLSIKESELQEMKSVTRVDVNSSAVLALARIGLEVSREGMGKREVRS